MKERNFELFIEPFWITIFRFAFMLILRLIFAQSSSMQLLEVEESMNNLLGYVDSLSSPNSDAMSHILFHNKWFVIIVKFSCNEFSTLFLVA